MILFPGNTTQADALLKIFKNDFFKPLEEISSTDVAVNEESHTATNGSVGNAGNGTVSSAGNGTAAGAGSGTLHNGIDDAEEPIKPLEPKCLVW